MEGTSAGGRRTGLGESMEIASAGDGVGKAGGVFEQEVTCRIYRHDLERGEEKRGRG